MLRKLILPGLLYGAALGLLAVLMAWGKYRLVIIYHAVELYALLIGIIFVVVGAWLGRMLTKPKTIVQQEIVIREVEVHVPAPAPQESKLFISDGAKAATGISQRELDVLQLLARGLSNEEIAAELFVSTNTVKTHLSNLYFKLDVKRRTQAVEKSRSMGLLGESQAAPPKG